MRHLNAFHVFHVAATSASLTEAAKKLCITHGAVSKQIKLLESHLSKSLFYRQGRHLYLTEEGEILKKYTAQAFDALSTGVKEISHRHQQHLEVSCEPTLTMRWLMPRLSSFYQDHPNADVRISTAGGPVVLGSTGLSLAIRRDDFELIEEYEHTKLVEEWVGPVCSPNYWQHIQKDLTTAKLLHSQTRPKAWRDWATRTKQTTLSHCQSQDFAHFYFCFQAAVDGLGIAMGSYPLIMDDLKRGNLIAPFGFVSSGHRYLLLSQKNQQHDELEQSFSAWLKNELCTCVPSDGRAQRP